MVGYLYFRFWDALSMNYTYQAGRTEGLAILTSGVLSFNFWFVEILLGAVVPIILLLNKKTRMMPAVRMLALAMIVAGVVSLPMGYQPRWPACDGVLPAGRAWRSATPPTARR